MSMKKKLISMLVDRIKKANNWIDINAYCAGMVDLYDELDSLELIKENKDSKYAIFVCKNNIMGYMGTDNNYCGSKKYARKFDTWEEAYEEMSNNKNLQEIIKENNCIVSIYKY